MDNPLHDKNYCIILQQTQKYMSNPQLYNGQYNQTEIRANKLQLLKKPIYPRLKKKKTPSSTSISPVKQKKQSAKIIRRYEQLQQNLQISPDNLQEYIDLFKNCKNEKKQMQNIIKMQFQHNYGTTSTNLSPMFQTVSHNFLSANNIYRKTVHKKLYENKKETKDIKIKDLSDQCNWKLLQPRDTQQILRKNSLFLLTFVKAKRKSKIQPNFQVPFIKNSPLKDLQKNYYENYYSNYKKPEIRKKSGILLEKIKVYKPQKPLIPQPW